MAVFTNTANAIADPQYYGTNMPEYGTPEWDQFLQWEQSQPWMQPAGQAPGSFTGPDGSQWSSAGSQRMADTTTGAYYANLFNQQLKEAAIQGGPNAKMFQLAMNSRAQIRPEEFQNAYNAHDELGNQVLVSPLAALFERLGIRPPGYNLPPGAGTGTHPPGVGGGTTVLPGGITAVGGGSPGVSPVGSQSGSPSGGGGVAGLNPERNIYLDPVSGQKWTLGGDGKWYTVMHGNHNDVGVASIDYNPWEQKPGDPGKIKNMQDLYGNLTQPPGGNPITGNDIVTGGYHSPTQEEWATHPGMVYDNGQWLPAGGNVGVPPDKIGLHPLNQWIPPDVSPIDPAELARLQAGSPGTPLIYNQQNTTPQEWQNFTNWVKSRPNLKPPVAPPTGYGF